MPNNTPSSALVLRISRQLLLACDQRSLSRLESFSLVTVAVGERFGLTPSAAAASVTVARRQLEQRSSTALLGAA